MQGRLEIGEIVGKPGGWSQALADTLPLALASLLQGNQNSSSDGAGWEDSMQKPEFRENSTSMALFPQCYEL